MNRKHRKRKVQRPGFVFTGETIKLTQEAMKRLAQALARVEDQPAQVAFAREMMQQVNRKLDVLATSVGAMVPTAFDYNERIVLVTAIHLYTLDLLSLPSDFQRERQLHQCEHIAAYFALGPATRQRSSKDRDDGS